MMRTDRKLLDIAKFIMDRSYDPNILDIADAKFHPTVDERRRLVALTNPRNKSKWNKELARIGIKLTAQCIVMEALTVAAAKVHPDWFVCSDGGAHGPWSSCHPEHDPTALIMWFKRNYPDDALDVVIASTPAGENAYKIYSEMEWGQAKSLKAAFSGRLDA
jgi:hypothetical protein